MSLQVARSQSSSNSVQGAPAAAGTSSGSQAADPDDGLKIAWQYRKYIQRAEASSPAPQRPAVQGSHSSASGSNSFRRASTSTSSSSSAAKNVAAGIGKEWCHQYDLTKNLTPAQLQGSKFETYCCQSQHGSSVTAASAAAVSFAKRFQPAGPIPGET